MIKMAFREDAIFLSNFSYPLQSFFSMKKEKDFHCYRLCDDRITCFDKGT
jgi:hypothetical protein